MARAQINSQNRIINWMDDESFESVGDEDKPLIANQFPIEFSNGELIMETAHYSIEDFVIENGVARYEPLPESIEAMAYSTALNYAPEHLADTDDAICHLYEETLAQQEIIDDQDAAICALYEMIGG